MFLPFFELSTSLTSLPVHLEDRFVIIDAEALREGNCIASVQQDASGLDVVAVCFQVVLKGTKFVLLHTLTLHPSVPSVVRYNLVQGSKVVAFHSLGVSYMIDNEALFKFKDLDETRIVAADGHAGLLLGSQTVVSSSSSSSSMSANESTARLAAKHLAFIVFGDVERLRVLAPDLVVSISMLYD
jgi:hypothetical protein